MLWRGTGSRGDGERLPGKRDAEWMGKIYEFWADGGVIVHDLDDRNDAAYASDITMERITSSGSTICATT